MATYENGILTTPCISHQATQTFYEAKFDPTGAAGRDDFSVTRATLTSAPKDTQCMAVYKEGTLTVPCIAYKAGKTVYSALLTPIGLASNLNFSVGSTTIVTHIQEATQVDPVNPTPVTPSAHIDHFDKGKIGTVPKQWKAGMTGRGKGDWQLVEDLSAPSAPLVLRQSGEGDFPWCVKQGSHLSDGFVFVKFKPISGVIDQAAGLVWRWKDADNYYVTRANALENNISIYHIKDGIRYPIQYETVPDNLPVKSGLWQTLRVDFQGNHFTVSFEGQVIVDIKDNEIEGKGLVGVWTKQDSVIYFDDFSYGK
jgi:hypothetical protein